MTTKTIDEEGFEYFWGQRDVHKVNCVAKKKLCRTTVNHEMVRVFWIPRSAKELDFGSHKLNLVLNDSVIYVKTACSVNGFTERESAHRFL